MFAKYPEALIRAYDEIQLAPASEQVDWEAILTLKPGNVIASGTPGGVGHARKRARYLTSVLATEITGLGRSEVKAVTELIFDGH